MPAKKTVQKRRGYVTLEEKNNYKVALVQMQSLARIDENFNQAVSYIHDAVAEHQAKLIVFPENFLCMGASDYSIITGKIKLYLAEFSKLAKRYAVSLLLGSVPINAGNGKCYSRSILIDFMGKQLATYDKIHLFDVVVEDKQGSYKESDSFLAGQKTTVAPLDFNKLGLTICYDLRFPELFQLLRVEGAEMIAVPSAFTYKTGQSHWEVLLRARAIETQCFILAANQCGTHYIEKSGSTRETWGHSMIVDPWGDILCSLEHSPGICSAVLDFSYLRKVRESMNLIKHKRL